MSPDFQIITSHLILRMVDIEETGTLCQLINQSPSLYEWIDWCHADFSEEETQAFIMATRLNWIKAQSFGFGIYHRCSQRLIGMVAINELYPTFNMASLGYWICDTKQKQGFGREAVLALVEFCFSKLKLTRVEMVCDPANIPSQKLIESCGALKEALARHRYVYNGEPRDGLVYAIIPADLAFSGRY